MRTNFAGFALSLGMGLIVLLIGFVALSTAGLVSLGPPVEGVETSSASPNDMFAGDIALPISTDSRSLKGANGAVVAGEMLFKNNCTQCHAVNEKIVGPALTGIVKRRAISWVVAWVHNPAKVIASGDAYATKIFSENNQQQMPSFPQLSATDVKNILAWIEWQEVLVTLPTESSTVQAVATR